jgi:quaternary ammonium compound-resistance protein SugE
MNASISGWGLVLVASLFEIAFALGLKYSNGFTRLWPSVAACVAAVVSVVLLARALTVLPVGTAYAAWTGLGAVGAAVFGAIVFREPVNAARIVWFGLIIAGLIGLRLSSRPDP